jgi:hypothetical protein
MGDLNEHSEKSSEHEKAMLHRDELSLLKCGI